MKKLLLLSAALYSWASQAQFTGYNMIELGRWDNDSLASIGTQTFSNGWGWADTSNGREYAIMGSVDSTYFIDVTDPENPVLCDVYPGRVARSIWREYKTYSHYCYAVADYGFSSLQIFDLQYLPDSVHLVYDDHTLISRSHTLYVDNHRLYCNSAINGFGQAEAVTVLSLADPENPSLLGHVKPPFFGGAPAYVRCHDAFVKNDTLYCSGENPGVFIYDLQDMNQPVFLGAILEYPERGYNHSGYLSDDGEIFVFTDENSGLGIKAFDVRNFNNMELLSLFRSNPGAIAHNPYFIGRTLYVSYYHDGVWIFDLEDPANPKVLAWYDTYPQNGTSYGGFEGCWGIYPYLPSGNILAFDQTNGLFVLKHTPGTAIDEAPETADLLLYPNPSNGRVQIGWKQAGNEALTLNVYDLQGKLVHSLPADNKAGTHSVELNLEGLGKGIYLIQLTGANTHLCRKLLLR